MRASLICGFAVTVVVASWGMAGQAEPITVTSAFRLNTVSADLLGVHPSTVYTAQDLYQGSDPWLDTLTRTGAGIDPNSAFYSLSSSASQTSSVNSPFGVFSASLSASALASYTGSFNASAFGASEYIVEFTISGEARYLFTAALSDTRLGPTGSQGSLFYSDNFTYVFGNGIGELPPGGGGVLQSGHYILDLATFATAITDGLSGGSDSRASFLDFNMLIRPTSPELVPEPATIWVLASMGMVGLVAGWRCRVRGARAG